MARTNYICALFLLIGCTLSAQSTWAPLGQLSYSLYERAQVISGNPLNQDMGIYPIPKAQIFALTDTILNAGSTEGFTTYLYNDNIDFIQSRVQSTEKRGLWNTFYQYPGRFFEVNQKDFGLVLNPVLYLKYSNSQDSGDPVFQNTRGLSIRGHIDQKVFFESSLFENQASFADYVERRMNRDTFTIGNGFNKSYSSDIFNIETGRDYLNATGTVGFNLTKSISASIGYDRNFLGHGYRSLLLSDFSNNYFHLKLNTRVWKIHYQNIFAQFFNNGTFASVDESLERKFLSLHYLNFRPTPNIQIGLFEAVIYNGVNGLDLPLLNPIIFYRSIEGFANQDGNAMLGADFRVNMLKRFSLYGQFVLDEFKFNEVFGDEPGWWANKFGVQVGAKYFNALGIENLDLQAEFNTVRPYTYSHRTKSTSYAHFNQPLAHPLGANFREAIAIAKYNFNTKWFVEGRVLRMSYGEDSDSTSWGGNILIPSSQRAQEYNNTISQGIDTDVWLVNFSVSYMFAHNMHLDLEYNLRSQKSELPARNYDESYIGFALRMNIGRQRFDL